MKTETIIVGGIETNCYIVYNEETLKGFIIDPGADADMIIRACRRLQVTPEAVVLTHGHFDHMTEAGKLKETFGIPVLAGENEEKLLLDSRANLSALWAVPCTIKPDRLLKDGEELNLAGMRLKTIETPGHTPGGICIYMPDEKVLFAGDTLFRESYGRTDFPGGSTSALFRSIGKLLSELPDNCTVFTGHGEETDIAHEKRYNPAAFCR